MVEGIELRYYSALVCCEFLKLGSTLFVVMKVRSEYAKNF
jgi:hypothetical protein